MHVRNAALLGLPALAVPGLGAVTKRAPLIQAGFPDDTIPGQYIVKFKDNADALLAMAVGKHKPDYVYTSKGFKGFAGALDTASLEELRGRPEVEFVEEDATVTIDAIISQPNPPWGLARISSRTPGSTEYRYDETAGAGTCSYIIDTGVDITNAEFTGRAVWGVNLANDNAERDGNGHGTHVAGVVGSVIYGVAKKTTIIAVKVLNASGSGTTAGVIAGMNWVANDSATRHCPNGTVANMSIGGGRSTAVNTAAKAVVDAGVFVSAAAGGSNDDAAFYSPASEPSVCTVGATDASDTFSWFSNYGELVDLFAPGVDIQSTWLAGGTETLSGTSFSAAHVTGLGAYLLGLGRNVSEAELCGYMQSIATKGVLLGIPSGTRNLLAYNGIDP